MKYNFEDVAAFIRKLQAANNSLEKSFLGYDRNVETLKEPGTKQLFQEYGDIVDYTTSNIGEYLEYLEKAIQDIQEQ